MSIAMQSMTESKYDKKYLLTVFKLCKKFSLR